MKTLLWQCWSVCKLFDIALCCGCALERDTYVRICVLMGYSDHACHMQKCPVH